MARSGFSSEFAMDFLYHAASPYGRSSVRECGRVETQNRPEHDVKAGDARGNRTSYPRGDDETIAHRDKGRLADRVRVRQMRRAEPRQDADGAVPRRIHVQG